MISVRIIAVGKLKETWLRDGCAQYMRRLGPWSRVDVIEIEESRLPENPSAAQIEAGLAQEGQRILKSLAKSDIAVALCIEGDMLSSERLASFFHDAAVGGVGSIAFVIGSSHGLSEQVKQAAKLRLSMSPMTFPHQLARLMLLEQIYRAMSINANTKYHK